MAFPKLVCGCSSKYARLALLVINVFTMLFSIALCGVGGLSLSYGKYFADRAEAYCGMQCISQTQVVGCDCGGAGRSPTSTLPFYFYLAPSIGIITIGALAFVTSILGIVGGVKKHSAVLLAYIIIMSLIILIQFSFACAAGVVASGNAGSVSQQLDESLAQYYNRFDWSYFQNVLPAACYTGRTTVTVPLGSGLFETETYYHPLCKFYGDCVTENPTIQELHCCNAFFRCDTVRPQCVSGNSCILSMLAMIGGPVAAVSFCSLIVEISAVFCAHITRQGRVGRQMDDGLLDRSGGLSG